MPLKRALAFAWIVAFPLVAQNEEALRRFFEGRNVRVKIDLPATKDGLDVYWRKNPPANMSSYSQRLRQYGPALRSGDPVAVTMLRVKGKNIEFQLGGGGYGVSGDDTGSVTVPSVPRTNREIELEKQISKEPDGDYRDRLKRDLARVRDQREAEERRQRARARELEALKKQEIANIRMQAGSRINLWFPDGRLKEDIPTPPELMQMLGEWIDFGPMNGGGAAPRAPVYANDPPPQRTPVYANDPPPPPAPPPAGSANSSTQARITRGMSLDQVHSILGAPRTAREGRQGDLSTLTETWERVDEHVEVLYVGGVVVKYSTSSR